MKNKVLTFADRNRYNHLYETKRNKENTVTQVDDKK